MDIGEEQFKDLLEESAQLGRASQQINADLFKQMAHAAVVPSDTPEKRSAARIGVRYTVTVRPIIPHINVAATPFAAVITDVSRDGVGLICPVGVYAQFTLEMPNEHGIIFAVNCTKRSLRKLAEHRYHVGATFDDPLDEPAKLPGSAQAAADAVDLTGLLPKHPAIVPFDLFQDPIEE
jgi:hypothetical protein